MLHQTKHRARISLCVLSTALIAFGTASLSALPAPAKAQQPTTRETRTASAGPNGTTVTTSPGEAEASMPQPPQPRAILPGVVDFSFESRTTSVSPHELAH